MSSHYKKDSILKYLFVFMFLSCLFLAGCKSSFTSPTTIPDPTVSIATPVAPGEEVPIKMELPPQSGEVSYLWSSEDGTFKGSKIDSSAIIWIAPEIPDTYIVYVQVIIDDTVAEKSVFITVEASLPPTFTPTNTPSPSPTSTSTNTPTSTLTPTPTDTITPTPSNTPTNTPTPTPCPYESVHVPLPNQSTAATVEISSPLNCTQVSSTEGRPVRVSGSYAGDLTGKEIWVFVVPELALDYFVQSAEACAGSPADASGNRWNTLVFLGGPPQSYDIVVVVVEEGGAASQAFKARLENGCASGSLGGYTQQEMSQFDILEAASITIFKEDE